MGAYHLVKQVRAYARGELGPPRLPQCVQRMQAKELAGRGLRTPGEPSPGTSVQIRSPPVSHRASTGRTNYLLGVRERHGLDETPVLLGCQEFGFSMSNSTGMAV